MDYTVPAPCPHCGVEIEMDMELTDDGLASDNPWGLTSQSWYQAVGIAPDDTQSYSVHTCQLTQKDIDTLCEIATDRAQEPYYRRDDGID